MTNNRMHYQKTERIMYDNRDKWYKILYAEQTFNPIILIQACISGFE